MKQILAILLLPFILVACNGLGTKKVKNIVELTPKLISEVNEPIYLDSIQNTLDLNLLIKNKEYSFTKNNTVTEPVLINNVLYALDIRANVSAFSKDSNKIAWSTDLSKNKKDNYIGGGILYYENKLYVTYGSRVLVVLDARSGYEIIRKELPDIIKIKPVLIDRNIILVQTVSNQIIALDTETLKVIWQHEGMQESLASSYSVTPIVHNKHVIATYNSGQVLAINVKDGEIVWGFELNNIEQLIIPNFEEVSILCAPVSDNNNLYIASGLGKIIKLDILTGRVVWLVDAKDVQSMALFGNSLFVTNNARQVAALSLKSGKVKFVANLSDNKDGNKLKPVRFLAPIVSRNNLGQNTLNIIASNGILYSFAVNNSYDLNSVPTITQIIKNIRYYGGEANNIYFSTDRKIIFEHTH